MHFRITCITKTLYLQEGQLFELSVDSGSRLITIRIENCPPEELPKLELAGARCVATTTGEAEEEKLVIFRDGAGKKDKVVQSLLEGIRIALFETLKRTIHDFKWRHAVIGSFDPIVQNSSLCWSTDGVNWQPAYPTPKLEMVTKPGFMMQQSTPETVASLEKLVSSQIDEPIGHELYNEAYELKWSNPRSSLVIGIAALETGIKECASHLVPNAEWLINNVQSPPLPKMLSHLLPQLPVVNRIAGKVLPAPKSMIKRVAEAVETRNRIAHGRGGVIDPEELWDFLRTARDLLYLLDYYRGHEWAWENIGHQTRNELLNMAGNGSN
jgi:hypothetical protein